MGNQAAKHTPGQFPLINADCTNGKYLIVTSQGNHYAETYDPSAARLIVAAPELLAAIELAMPALEYVRKQFPRIKGDDSIDVLAVVQAAIAKATGAQA